MLSLVAFLFIFFCGFYFLQTFGLNQKSTVIAFLLSGIGHYIGAYALYEYTLRVGTDSLFYFYYGTTKFGFNYYFAQFLLGYAKKYILGNSFLGAFLLSGMIGWIASIYLVLTYKVLLDKISGHAQRGFYNSKYLVLPVFLLFCWPSYFFWSAGLIKDNFSFIAMAVTLFTIAKGKFKLPSLLIWAFVCIPAFIGRPYLVIIFGVSVFIYVVIGNKMDAKYKLILFLLFGVTFIFVKSTLLQFMSFVHFSGGLSLQSIGEYAIRQQTYMSTGSSIPVPTHNPYLMFLFIPYLFAANLFLPLIVGARNLIGMVASIENLYLLFWVCWFLKHWSAWKNLIAQLKIVKLLLIYFLFGMSCLCIMSTNFGLSMREKELYVPALLICMFLTKAYYKMQAHSVKTSKTNVNATLRSQIPISNI